MEARQGCGGKKAKSRLMGLKKKRDRNALGKPETQCGLLGCQLTATFTTDTPQGQPEVSPKEKGNLCLRGANQFVGQPKHG